MQAVFLAENAVREEPWQKRALGAGRRDDDPHSAQRVFRSARSKSVKKYKIQHKASNFL